LAAIDQETLLKNLNLVKTSQVLINFFSEAYHIREQSIT